MSAPDQPGTPNTCGSSPQQAQTGHADPFKANQSTQEHRKRFTATLEELRTKCIDILNKAASERDLNQAERDNISHELMKRASEISDLKKERDQLARHARDLDSELRDQAQRLHILTRALLG